VLEVELAANGVLLSAHLHPFLLDSTGRPRTDPTGQAWQQVRELSAADLPDTGVEIHEDGQIGWIGSAPGGYQGSD